LFLALKTKKYKKLTPENWTDRKKLKNRYSPFEMKEAASLLILRQPLLLFSFFLSDLFKI
jgi:hypothetical protein